MFRLSIVKLRAAAKKKGDETGYSIAKRTGLHETAISRFLRGHRQPDLNSALLMAKAYEIPVEDLMEYVEAAA